MTPCGPSELTITRPSRNKVFSQSWQRFRLWTFTSETNSSAFCFFAPLSNIRRNHQGPTRLACRVSALTKLSTTGNFLNKLKFSTLKTHIKKRLPAMRRETFVRVSLLLLAEISKLLSGLIYSPHIEIKTNSVSVFIHSPRVKSPDSFISKPWVSGFLPTLNSKFSLRIQTHSLVLLLSNSLSGSAHSPRIQRRGQYCDRCRGRRRTHGRKHLPALRLCNNPQGRYVCDVISQWRWRHHMT